jgi:hypothetical protein
MPSNHHVSFFVVWQAVEQLVNPPLPGDQHIFLPWVAGPSQELPMPPVIAPEEGGPEAPASEAPPVDEPPSDETAEPVAPQPPTDDPLLRTLREDAWLRVGIESSHETALAAYARQTGLGMPVTHEFVSGDFTAQGFAGGIVFARTDDPAAITHIAW